MRQRVLFDRLCVYVCPDALASADFELLECCLRDGGAALSTDAQHVGVTHVVCHPSEYARFAGGRAERFFAIVRPEWVLRAFVLQKIVPVDTFSADPRLFFSTLAIAAGSIDKDPRKVIDGLIAHFGGQVIEDPSDVSGATHVLSPDGVASEAAVTDAQRALQLAYSDADVARQVELWKQWLDERPASLDFPLPGCVVAHIGKGAGVSETHHVNYAWIEECVRRKQRIAEAAFSKTAADGNSDLPNWKSRMDVKVEDLELGTVASVYLNARAAAASTSAGELAVMRKLSPDRLAVMQSTLAGAIVLVAQHIPSQLKEPVAEILKTAKAKVANVPLGDSYPDIVRKVVTNASFVVCRYQSGLEYEEAVRQKKQIVSVYWVLAGLGVASEGGELREALMQPIQRFGGVPGMESFVITLSGFNSRTVPTREDVQMAIQATGACVLPVLSRSHSTHLLCYEAKGEKFKKAQSWNFDNILSPDWLLECLTKWKYIPEAPFRMTSGGGTDIAKPATSESAPLAAETEKEDVEAGAAAAVTGVTSTLTPSGTDEKTGSSRFDVDELLDELNDHTPKTTPKRGAGALKLDSAAAADVPAKLFDTPTSATRKRTLRGSTDGGAVVTDGLEASIPEDFEFQFGKKTKPKGTAKAAEKKVAFEEKPSGKEAIKAKRNAKRKAGGVAEDAIGTAEDTAQEVVESPPSKVGVKGSKKAAPSTGRKRKSTEADNAARPTTASSEDSKAPPTASKKKKTATKPSKMTSTGAPASSDDGSGRLFLLTGSREECAINESLITSLGGAVSQVKGRIYDPECTHIITSELKRTEKFVAGCAAGKWILKQSYLDASSAAGRFVDEAVHEWGANEADVDEMDPRIWPPVCSFWRKARAETERTKKTLTPGAFDGWRFLVHPKAVPPAEMCERVIAASDGEVIPLSSAMDLATVAASDTKEKPVVALIHAELSSRDVWLKKFRASKVRCINASFLIDYLTKDQTNRPKVDDYVL